MDVEKKELSLYVAEQGVKNKKLLECPLCWSVGRAEGWERRSGVGLVYGCSCGGKWYVCTECDTQRVGFESFGAWKRHCKRHLSGLKDRKESKKIGAEVDGKCSRSSWPLVEDIDKEESKFSGCRSVRELYGLAGKKDEVKMDMSLSMSEKKGEVRGMTDVPEYINSNYFSVGKGSRVEEKNEAVDKKRKFNNREGSPGCAEKDEVPLFGEGSRVLVGNALKCVEKVEVGVVDLHMRIGQMCLVLTKPQREKLADVFLAVERLLPREIGRRLQLPTSGEAMRSLYVDGCNAILPNLPRPGVQEVGDHSYVSPVCCVADMLAHGMALDSVPREVPEVVQSLGSSAESVLRRDKIVGDSRYGLPSLHVWLTEWSDDFDPNTSSKSNRGSVWIKTLTISAPPEHVNRGLHTYAVTMGPKRSNHEVVENMFQEDLETGCLLVSLQDQPERRACTYMLGGNSR